MKITDPHTLITGVLTAFAAVAVPAAARAQSSIEPHEPLIGYLSFPSPTPIWGPDQSWSRSWSGSDPFGLYSWTDTFSLDIRPVVVFQGDLVVLTCPGYVSLQLMDPCGLQTILTFIPTNPATANMNVNLQVGGEIRIGFNGSYDDGVGVTPPGNFPAFYDSKPLTCYGFTGGAALSATWRHNVIDVTSFEALTATCGWVVGALAEIIGDLSFQLNETLTLSQNITAEYINSSAGTVARCGQTLLVSLTNCAYCLNNIQEVWRDNVSVAIGMDGNFHVSVLLGIFSWDLPIGATTVMSETIRTNVLSEPIPPVCFNLLGNYTVTGIGGSGGSVSPNLVSNLCQGQCVHFVGQPLPGYYTSGWLVDGTRVSPGGNSFTLPSVNANATVVALFSPVTSGYPFGVLTLPGSNITSGSVVIAGNATPNGNDTTAWFQWGLTTVYENTTGPTSIGSGFTNVVVTNLLVGLVPNTIYHYRIGVSNFAGFADGGDQTFTTATANPTVSGLSLSLLDNSSVLLHGVVNPEGSPALAWFSWGPGTNLGNETLTTPVHLPASAGDTDMVFPLANLAPAASYHYALVANQGATFVSTPYSNFTTLGAAPSVSSGPVTNVSTDTALFSGTVNPNGLETTAWFSWGTTTNYGNAAPDRLVSCGNGNTNLYTSFELGSLSAQTTYHVQLVASNAAGVAYSSDQVFLTSPAQPAWMAQVPRFGSNGVQLTLAGTFGQTYQIQASSNLQTSSWLPLTNLSFTGGVQTFLDTLPPSNQRFYRAVLLGP
jgi:hypothetical protein